MKNKKQETPDNTIIDFFDSEFSIRNSYKSNQSNVEIFKAFFGSSPVGYSAATYFDKSLLSEFYEFVKKQGFICYYTSSFKKIFLNVEKKWIIEDEYSSTRNTYIEEEGTEEIDTSTSQVTCRSFMYHLNSEYSKEIIKFEKDLKRFESRKTKNKFYLIANDGYSCYTQPTSFTKYDIKDSRFDLFYGKEFPYEKLKDFMNCETENLMLLHGDPGTGKSNFIKHLISESDKKVLYIPPSMLEILSSPNFITFMINNKDSILLIEDGEEILSKQRNAATNNLLGLTDGFLKDALNLKVICTFNTDIGNIDPALLRKGRVYFEYKFDKLSKDECKDLANFMDLNVDISSAMTISELFNSSKEVSQKNSFEERTIGFL
jgi:hypothetical protein